MFNFDRQKSLFEPIEFILEGKKYTIAKVSSKMMEKVNEATEDKKDIFGLVHQLALLTGAKDEEFTDVDIRKIAQVLRFIMSELTKQFGAGIAKNASKAEEKK